MSDSDYFSSSTNNQAFTPLGTPNETVGAAGGTAGGATGSTAGGTAGGTAMPPGTAPSGQVEYQDIDSQRYFTELKEADARWQTNVKTLETEEKLAKTRRKTRNLIIYPLTFLLSCYALLLIMVYGLESPTLLIWVGPGILVFCGIIKFFIRNPGKYRFGQILTRIAGILLLGWLINGIYTTLPRTDMALENGMAAIDAKVFGLIKYVGIPEYGIHIGYSLKLFILGAVLLIIGAVIRNKY